MPARIGIVPARKRRRMKTVKKMTNPQMWRVDWKAPVTLSTKACEKRTVLMDSPARRPLFGFRPPQWRKRMPTKMEARAWAA